MALFQINHISMDGLACAVPKNRVNNSDYPYHSAKENKQFIATTGIEYRSIVNDNTTAADLCFEAANQLINHTKIASGDVNIIVFLSQTPDYKIPCTATILQERLGLGRHCIAFDINLGCSGFVYGISVVASLLSQIKGKALLLVGDTSSTCVNQADKSSAPLFSDAGSATLLSYNEEAKPMFFNLQSDGKGHDAIITSDGGARNPFSEESLKLQPETNRRPIDMLLDGIKVFNFSRKEVAPNLETLFAHFNLSKENHDYFIFHQANMFMNESIRKKLQIEPAKVPYSLKDYGNTSSASIPVTMVHQLRETLISNEHTLALSGFGVGLSWGSVSLTVNQPLVLPMITV